MNASASSPVTRETFLRHFQETERPLRTYLWCATRDPHATDDLLQNVWKTLWIKLDRYDPARPFIAWAMGIARIEVLRWRQAHARSREVLSEASLDRIAATVEEHAGDIAALQRHLDTCLKKLPKRSRGVLRLFYADRLRIADIAARLQRTVGAVEMQLVRLRRALRDCIEERIAAEDRP
jgi:RNA polymerase sigma-70 factor, ECF subfamily